MILYLDVCCLNRPFDNPSQPRVRVEAEAVLSILELADSGRVTILRSDIIDDELSQMPDHERREKVDLLLGVTRHVSLTAAIESRAIRIHRWNISPLDALHLAAADIGGAEYFLTTDDDLLRRASRHKSELK